MLSKIYYPELIADNYIIGMATERNEVINMLIMDEIPVTDCDNNGCSFFVNFTDEFAERLNGPLVCSCEASMKLAKVIRNQCITEDEWGLKFNRERCVAILRAMADMQLKAEEK